MEGVKLEGRQGTGGEAYVVIGSLHADQDSLGNRL